MTDTKERATEALNRAQSGIEKILRTYLIFNVAMALIFLIFSISCMVFMFLNRAEIISLIVRVIQRA